MNSFEVKYLGYKFISELLLRAVNLTTLWCFYIIIKAYQYLVLGVEAEYVYANKAAKIILPAIWNDILSPMVWKIPLIILLDIALRVFLSNMRQSS